MLIRPENPSDSAAISLLTARAFAGSAHSDGTEQHIVAALRASGALTVSLVAEVEDSLIGHVAISPVNISDGTPHWYGLGPISVEPAFQHQGVGSKLMRASLSQLAALGAAGCVVLGKPAFYGRFGFRATPELTYPGPSPEYFMAQAFRASSPHGQVTYHPAFAGET